MAVWKLVRLFYGEDEYLLRPGDTVTIGRASNNVITLTSAVVSRYHCLINFLENVAEVTDLESANGVYIGNEKIPPKKPYIAKNSDIIGIGWGCQSVVVKIKDTDKYVFRLELVDELPPVVPDASQKDDIEEQLSILDRASPKLSNDKILTQNRLSLKRKSDIYINPIKDEIPSNNNDVINISDSDTDIKPIIDKITKKAKLEVINESPNIQPVPIARLISEKEDLPFETFNVRQDHWKSNENYLIEIESDSDSDSESNQWLARLSQSSPRKSYNLSHQVEDEPQLENSSYSQMDDLGPLINLCDDEEDNYVTDYVDAQKTTTPDVTDGVCIDLPRPPDKENAIIDKLVVPKKTKLLTSPVVQAPQDKINKVKSKNSSSRSSKAKKETFRREISKSDKEARKNKLREIAEKEKISSESHIESSPHNTSKPKINKRTSSSSSTSRGAFLSDTVQVVSPLNTKKYHEVQSDKKRGSLENQITELSERDNKSHTKDIKSDKSTDIKLGTETKKTSNESNKQVRTSGKALKPLLNKEDVILSDKTNQEKPILKVDPLPPVKSKKTVRFSDAGPQVRVFEIEPGNKMKKTSLVKTTLIDTRHMPQYPANKLTLTKILRWNPHWLDEQTTTDDPPPILGHNKTPTTIFHSFTNHNQYLQQVGDLLLMEIWECLTVAYLKGRDQRNEITMQVESIPVARPQENILEFANIGVNMSLPSSEVKKVPRVGEIIIATFGPEHAKCNRFFFVHNVRCLPSPPSNVNSFFSLSLQGAYSARLMSLRLGETISAQPLAYINNELMLFEAMDYLNVTPLSEIILRPEPHHFPPIKMLPISSLPWNLNLNTSQLKAVNASVAAALSGRPSIQMVQGPPGTGKSSVICCMVMSYFYDAQNKRNTNRGKILICATSNAAVDSLVIRLLNIRQTLPKSERFRMVRVGRAESMHPRALPVSSQQLAHRDATRAPAHAAHSAHSALAHELSHLEAKLNMWRTAELDAKDPVRVAYCQTRRSEIMKRIALVRASEGGGGGGGGGGGAASGEALAQAERRIVEGADIIVTTLASAHTHKTKGLKRRIALCIIDEAGQVIEPETLIPLMLDVTHITLVGDPQQLPGYICSQRAKKYGLGESLFARLTSCTELWRKGSPVILLDQQYRMHPDIVDYPNRAFYDSKIKTALPPSPDLGIPHYSVLSISGGDKGQGGGGGGGGNEWEARGAARVAAALCGAARARGLSVAVITPYNAHKELIKRNLHALLAQEAGAVDVNTVDSFQGQERDVVVVSLARSHGVGFLTDAGRLNVMLTRARHALLICLNPYAVMKNNQWRTLIEDAQRRNMYYMFPNFLCHPISKNEPPLDNVLKHIYVDKQRKY